jgi:hypothetical protein
VSGAYRNLTIVERTLKAALEKAGLVDDLRTAVAELMACARGGIDDSMAAGFHVGLAAGLTVRRDRSKGGAR